MDLVYSKTPLEKKLGLKAKMTVKISNPPSDVKVWFDKISQNFSLVYTTHGATADFIMLFYLDYEVLRATFLEEKAYLDKGGMMWICWPKGKSKVKTDLNRDRIREFILKNGLVDVKICSINEIWSGLKLVYRLSDR